MLKVVAGKYRSRLLKVPSTLTVPTKSIVRTAICNALSSTIPSSRVLDLFAGSGALGIEALSRGASSCIFVDKAKEAVSVIQSNLALLNEKNGQVLQSDYQSALCSFATPFDLIFLDPPYAMKEVYQEVPQTVIEKNILKKGGAIVLEYEGTIEAPLSLFSAYREYNYGRTHVLILWR